MVKSLFKQRFNTSVQAAKMDDLWPSEWPWAVLDTKLGKRHKMKKKQGLKKAITEVWRSVTPAQCRSLLKKVPIRLKQIIKQKGERLHGRRSSDH